MELNILDDNQSKRFDIHTPKEEVERILKQSLSKIIHKIFEKGHPIRTIDETGVHDLYPDGTKKYRESTKKNEEEND